MNPLPPNAVLLLIDVQQGMDDPAWGQRNNPQAEANMARLLDTWRATGRPVFHVQHLSLSPTSPLRAELPGCAIKEEVRPLNREPLFKKHVNSAFIGTDLEAQLRAHDVNTLVIVGLTTQHCVSTTARMAGNLGFTTYLVADATVAFELTGHDGQHYSADEIHNVSLATLHGEFATVVNTATVLRALGPVLI
jgi:nicotinamidase-related amidase